MVFRHRNFLLLFRILGLIYSPTITNEETYVAGGGGVQCNRVLPGFRKSAPGLLEMYMAWKGTPGHSDRHVVNTARCVKTTSVYRKWQVPWNWDLSFECLLKLGHFQLAKSNDLIRTISCKNGGHCQSLAMTMVLGWNHSIEGPNLGRWASAHWVRPLWIFFVTNKLFILTLLGIVLGILNFITSTCLYETILEINYILHAESAGNYLIQKLSIPISC